MVVANPVLPGGHAPGAEKAKRYCLIFRDGPGAKCGVARAPFTYPSLLLNPAQRIKQTTRALARTHARTHAA